MAEYCGSAARLHDGGGSIRARSTRPRSASPSKPTASPRRSRVSARPGRGGWVLDLTARARRTPWMRGGLPGRGPTALGACGATSCRSVWRLLPVVREARNADGAIVLAARLVHRWYDIDGLAFFKASRSHGAALRRCCCSPAGARTRHRLARPSPWRVSLGGAAHGARLAGSWREPSTSPTTAGSVRR